VLAGPSRAIRRARLGLRPGPIAVLALVYIAVLFGFLMARRQVVTPDLLLLLFVPIALLTGRFVSFLRDWVPLLALLFGWEAMRGVADRTGGTAYSDTWRIEEALFGGRLPTVVLQELARTHGWAGWLDPAMTVVYFAHFPAALGFALMLWLADRGVFFQYMVTLLAMSFAAFVVFLIWPTAPPWWSAFHGQFSGLDRIFQHTLVSHLDSVYAALSPNPVAAIPSLHAAMPFLGFLAFRRVWPRAAWLALAWSAVVWFAIVYLGEHYVLDAVAGVAWVLAFWWAVQKFLVPRFDLLTSSHGRDHAAGGAAAPHDGARVRPAGDPPAPGPLGTGGPRPQGAAQEGG
jgi:PAP2 superfamily protein